MSVEDFGGASGFSGGGARTEFLSIRREASVPYEKAWLQKIRNDGFRYAVWEGRTQINCLGVTWLRSATLLSREPPQDPAFPFMAFTGVREDEFFQTGHRPI